MQYKMYFECHKKRAHCKFEMCQLEDYGIKSAILYFFLS